MDEEDAVRGGLSSLSGLICEIINTVGQGNFTLFCLEKVREFQKPLAMATMSKQEKVLCVS